MNEELKIIIKAVNDSAKKAVKEVSSELEKLGGSAKQASGKVGAAMKGIAKGVTIAIAAIIAVGAAIVNLGKKSLQAQKEQAQLIAAFQAAGSSAEQAAISYNKLYRFLGESDRAREAGAHLAKITTNEQDLAEWTNILQGVFATFNESLPVEGLAEAANETIRVGKVTGTLADALNWAGVSEDEFNARLATTNSYAEREALVRETLNGLYGEAAKIYEKNNKALLDYNESQAKLDTTLAEAGSATLPLLTALNNLGSAFLTVLKPALDVIIPPIATFIDMVAKAVESVLGLFGAISGKSSTIKTVANGFKGAASGANNLSSGLGSTEDAASGANKQLQELKKSTQGFDELNIVPSGKGSAGGSSGAGAGTPSYNSPSGSGAGGGGLFGVEVEESEGAANGLAKSIKKAFEGIADVFEPTIKAWGKAFDKVRTSWKKAKPDFVKGAQEIKKAFSNLGNYLFTDFVPTIVNSFSVNLAPVISDVFGFALVEAGKQFEWIAKTISRSVDEIIIPAFESIKTVGSDVFKIIGDAWNEHGEALLGNFSTFFENLRGHFDNFYENVFKPVWDKILEVFNLVWDEHLAPLVEKFVNAFMIIGNEILIFYNEILAPVVDWVMTNIYPNIVNFVNGIIETVGGILGAIGDTIGGIIEAFQGLIQFVVGVFTLDWEKAWEGIKNFFSGIWDAICGIVDVIIEVFSGVIDFIGGAFTLVWKTAWETIKGVWNAVSGYFSRLWEDIKKVFANVGSWFKDVFSKAWKGIKDVFSGVGSFFSGIWTTIKSKFTDIGSKIGDAVSGGFKNAINWVLEKAIGLINGFIDGINWAIDIINAIPGVEISTISRLEVPQFAKGGIVDRATLGVFGEAGKEAVIPLENNTEWMDILADRIASRNNTPSKIVMMLDGKELGWANINSINDITRQTGKLHLAFA